MLAPPIFCLAAWSAVAPSAVRADGVDKMLRQALRAGVATLPGRSQPHAVARAMPGYSRWLQDIAAAEMPPQGRAGANREWPQLSIAVTSHVDLGESIK